MKQIQKRERKEKDVYIVESKRYHLYAREACCACIPTIEAIWGKYWFLHVRFCFSGEEGCTVERMVVLVFSGM